MSKAKDTAFLVAIIALTFGIVGYGIYRLNADDGTAKTQESGERAVAGPQEAAYGQGLDSGQDAVSIALDQPSAVSAESCSTTGTCTNAHTDTEIGVRIGLPNGWVASRDQPAQLASPDALHLLSPDLEITDSELYARRVNITAGQLIRVSRQQVQEPGYTISDFRIANLGTIRADSERSFQVGGYEGVLYVYDSEGITNAATIIAGDYEYTFFLNRAADQNTSDVDTSVFEEVIASLEFL